MLVQQDAPAAVADICGSTRRIDDVGEQHGREYPFVAPYWACAGHKLEHRVEQRLVVVRVPARVHRQRKLDVPSALDVRSEVAAVRDVDHWIARCVHDKRGDVQSAQQRSNVDLEVAAHDLHDHVGRTRVAFEVRGEVFGHLLTVRDKARCSHGLSGTPHLGQQLEHRLAIRVKGRTGGPIRRSARDPERPVERKTFDALRICRGEQHRHRTALRHSEEVRASPSRGIKDRAHIIRALSETSESQIAARKSRTSLVERDHAANAAESTQQVPDRRRVPVELQVRNETRDEDDRWAVYAAELLPGDIRPAGTGRVMDSRCVHFRNASTKPERTEWLRRHRVTPSNHVDTRQGAKRFVVRHPSWRFWPIAAAVDIQRGVVRTPSSRSDTTPAQRVTVYGAVTPGFCVDSSRCSSRGPAAVK